MKEENFVSTEVWETTIVVLSSDFGKRNVEDENDFHKLQTKTMYTQQ